MMVKHEEFVVETDLPGEEAPWAVAKEYSWRIKLHDHRSLQDWLGRFGTWHRHGNSSLWLPEQSSEIEEY